MDEEKKVDLDTYTQENADNADSLEEKNRQLFARAKSSERELKEYKEKAANLEKELAELKKAQESKAKKSDEFGLLELAYLKSSGILEQDEIDLAKKYYADFGGKRPLNEVVEHPFFKAELEKIRTEKANAVATDVKGQGAESGAKNTPEYWIARATKTADGKLAFPDDLPNDRKLRAAIMNKLGDQEKTGKTFYND